MEIQIACKFSDTLVFHSAIPALAKAMFDWLERDYPCFDFTIGEAAQNTEIHPFTQTDRCIHVMLNGKMRDEPVAIPASYIFDLRIKAAAFWEGWMANNNGI